MIEALPIMNFQDFIPKYQQIKARGFIKTHRKGNTGVGHTLEQELGLTENMGLTDPQWKLNLNALPDYQKVAQQIAQGNFPLLDLK